MSLLSQDDEVSLPLLLPVDTPCTDDSAVVVGAAFFSSGGNNASGAPAAAAALGCPLGGRDRHTPALVSAQLAVSALALAGNGLVLHLIRSSPSLHTANNLFVSALAAADVLVAANVPFYVTFYFDVPYKCDRTLCAVRYLLALYVTVLSVLLLVGVAVDRYLSVIHSLKYHSFMRFKLAKRIIAFVYVYVAAVVAAPAYWAVRWRQPMECDLVYILEFWYVCCVVLFHVAVTLFATVAIYALIFNEAWKKLHQQCQCVLTPKAAQIRSEAKTAKTMALILGVHMFSLAPYLAVVVGRYFAPQEMAPALSDAKKFVCVLYFGKSAVNPFIYGWKNKELRRALVLLIRRRRGDRRNGEEAAAAAVAAAGINERKAETAAPTAATAKEVPTTNANATSAVIVHSMLETAAGVTNYRLAWKVQSLLQQHEKHCPGYSLDNGKIPSSPRQEKGDREEVPRTATILEEGRIDSVRFIDDDDGDGGDAVEERHHHLEQEEEEEEEEEDDEEERRSLLLNRPPLDQRGKEVKLGETLLRDLPVLETNLDAGAAREDFLPPTVREVAI